MLLITYLPCRLVMRVCARAIGKVRDDWLECVLSMKRRMVIGQCVTVTASELKSLSYHREIERNWCMPNFRWPSSLFCISKTSSAFSICSFLRGYFLRLILIRLVCLNGGLRSCVGECAKRTTLCTPLLWIGIEDQN